MFDSILSPSYYSLRIAIPALVLFCAAPADLSAQESSDKDEVDAVDEIVVTGSRIKRRDFTSTSPLATIDRSTIEFSGQATLEDTLNQMPQVVPDSSRTSNAIGDGTSRINLRGLGAGRTLVLLNGRRVAPSGTGSAVDVNNLPQALIERVEIITGGATAVYGSDAVAGVVNFITRDDFDGFAAEGSAYTTAEGDSETYDLNVAYGHELANGKGNVAVFVGLLERNELFMADREISQVLIFNDPSTGTLIESGSSITPSGVVNFPRVDFGNGPARTTFDANGVPREFVFDDDFYNFFPINYLQTPLSRRTAGVMATFEMGNSFELYAESAFTNNEARVSFAEVTVRQFATVNVDNPVLSPEAQQHFIDYYESAPGLAQVIIDRRMSELGPRQRNYDRDYWRTVLGMRGELGRGWEIDGWITYTSSDEREDYLNAASRNRFLQGLLVDPLTGQCFDPSGGCVPVDVFGAGRISEEAQEFLRIPHLNNDTRRTQTMASAYVSGSPVDTWAGPLDVAVGIDWREDDAKFRADEELFTGDAMGFSGRATVQGKESVIEAYAETVVPLLAGLRAAESLMLEAGVRYSDYDNAGGVTTYKAGVEWRPVDGLAIRAMHQKSVRAPNNQELFEETAVFPSQFGGSDGSRDPCSASNDPAGAGNTEKCVLQGLPADQVGIFQASPVPMNYIGGGNTELVPEEARTTTAGIVLTPEFLPGWSLSIDYYDLEVTDSIGPIDAVDICFDPSNTINLFCDNITRDPDPSGAAGNVIEILEPLSNRGALGARGIDTVISWDKDLRGDATLSLNTVWSHTLAYEWQQAPFSETFDCRGYFGYICNFGTDDDFGWTFPDNRVTTNINFGKGRLGLHLTWRWIDSVRNSSPLWYEFFGFPEPIVAIETIGSKNYADIGASYDFTDNIRAKFGISNVLDTEPPMMAEEAHNANTDPGLYDVFGRSFRLAFSVEFPAGR